MPLNEITAASTSVMKYVTDTNHEHQVRLYFDAVPVADENGVFQFPTYTSTAHPTGWSLRDIWAEVWERLALDTSRVPAITVSEVEVWESALGDNVFVGIDGGDYTTVVGGAAASIAAAYKMMLFKAANRAQFRLTIFDTGDAKPQRTIIPPQPATDNGSIGWFMVKSEVGFVTNDNLPLVTLATQNTGYNRKLARSYGRQLEP